MGQRLSASFDELIRNRYGAKAADDPRFALRVEELYASYYGVPSTSQPPQGSKATSVVLSRTDDGERLRQRGARARYGQTLSRSTQYVAQKSHCGCGGTATGGEYVARRAPSSQPVMARQQSTSPSEQAFEECGIDLADKAAPLPASSVPAAPSPASAPRDASRVLQPEVLPPERATASSTNDNDFLADMQSILMGQKVFDPASKKTVDKGAATPPERPLPEAKNEQAIFDRIAQSMQYANAYDLGSIDLENRFSDFDEMSDRQERVAAARKATKGTSGNGAAAKAPAPVGNEDFLHDLDEIRQPAVSQSKSVPGSYSEPLFDTGEHAQTAGNLYDGQLHVGSGRVPFSYGQIVCMADLYGEVGEMMAADTGELQRLKSLIERDTTHYTSGSTRSVSTDEWEQATTNRYLRLAEQNYEHFSPNPIFKQTALARAPQRWGNNKEAWEFHHRWAIKEAQRQYQSAPNQSNFYEYPLIINAFGDHFLTDAFASGHAINKEFTQNLFKSKFLSGNSLTAKGKKFFEKVASKAWQGDIARRFSALETVDYPVCALGWCLKWHPNIDSASRFSKVLIGAAEQQPDRIANFAVKALHDYLNRTGLEVTNNAGGGTWRIKGDGYLDAANLAIIQRAVQQSVDNINDPAIMASGANIDQFVERVWKHVPQPTTASLTELQRLTNEYTNPDSDVLADAAAALVHSELDALIRTLLDEHKLQVA